MSAAQVIKGMYAAHSCKAVGGTAYVHGNAGAHLGHSLYMSAGQDIRLCGTGYQGCAPPPLASAISTEHITFGP